MLYYPNYGRFQARLQIALTAQGVVQDMSVAVAVLDSVPSAQTDNWIPHREEKGRDPGKLGLTVYHIRDVTIHIFTIGYVSRYV